MEELYRILASSTEGQRSNLSIIKYSDSTVFADSLNDYTSASQHVIDTKLISQSHLDQLRAGIDAAVLQYKTTTSLDELQEALANNVVLGDDAMYTAYPIPLPDNSESDPSLYTPEYLVIHAISYQVFDLSQQMHGEIERQVQQIVVISFLVGLLGIAVTFLILWVVSKGLTDPLLWIKHVAWGIVNHDDMGSTTESLVLSSTSESSNFRRGSGTGYSRWWAPRTEIAQLLREFRAMVQGFSGEGAAKRAYADTYEIRNQLTWQSVYQQLYARSSKAIDERKSVRISSVDSDVVSPPPVQLNEREMPRNASAEDDGGSAPVLASEDETAAGARSEVAIVVAPPKKNHGPNVISSDFRADKELSSQFGSDVHVYRSSLFWWIFLLIALPLIATTASIGWVLSSRIVDTASVWIHVIGADSQTLELKALESSATLKAAQATRSVGEVIRDLYFMTRVAGWLLFDALPRSESFTSLQMSANECRG